MRKWLVLIVFIVLGFVAYNYVFHEHRNIQIEPADFVMRSEDLIHEFSINPTASEHKYLNKIIELHGTISEKNEFNLTLNDNVFCQFDSKIDSLKTMKVEVKGRFIGFDDLLQQVKIDHCSIATEND